MVANPFDPKIKQKINETIKDRDFWMPFAASILEDYADTYFKLDLEVERYAFMTNTVETSEEGRLNLAAAIHPYDGTCRPHIVKKGSNPPYEKLINSFGNITGIYGLLNTSLNLHGLPICSCLEDALHVFANGNLDGPPNGRIVIAKIMKCL